MESDWRFGVWNVGWSNTEHRFYTHLHGFLEGLFLAYPAVVPYGYFSGYVPAPEQVPVPILNPVYPGVNFPGPFAHLVDPD